MNTIKRKKLCRITYRDEALEEFYDLEISLDGGLSWELHSCYEFVHAVEFPSGGANYLHYDIIKGLTRCIEHDFVFIGFEREGIKK